MIFPGYDRIIISFYKEENLTERIYSSIVNDAFGLNVFTENSLIEH